MYLVVSYMLGEKSTVQQITKAKKNFENFENIVWEEVPQILPEDSIEALQNQINMDNKRLEIILNEVYSKSVTIAELSFYDAKDKILTALRDSQIAGETMKDWVSRLTKEDIVNTIGFSEANPYYLETVFRTNSSSAINAGAFVRAMNEKDIEMLTYSAVLDKKTTQICQTLDGTTATKNNHIWDTITPPNHFNCRSRILSLTSLEINALGIEPKLPDTTPDIPESFRTNQATNDNWKHPSPNMLKRMNDLKNKKYE